MKKEYTSPHFETAKINSKESTAVFLSGNFTAANFNFSENAKNIIKF